MSDKIKKLSNKANNATSLLSNLKPVPTGLGIGSLIKQWLLPATLLTLLGTWIAMSKMSSDLFLTEALLCSSIVCSLLFFVAADQRKKSNSKH